MPKDIEIPLIPARMLNEWTYCPRLAILEWVQGEFAENEFTADGTFAHRRVDRPGRALEALSDPAPDDIRVTRSVYLESPSDGIVAKMDLVEVTAGEVIPVDTKRGRPPRPDQEPTGAWQPDRIQLGAQCLVLRSHGYRCERGYLYYAESRRRVEVLFDDVLLAQVRECAGELRAAAASGQLPPPLVQSPRCQGCSLAPICLPDETRLLALASEAPSFTGPSDIDTQGDVALDDEPEVSAVEGPDHIPEPEGPDSDAPTTNRVRRLIAPRDDRRPLDVSDSRVRVGCEKERFVIKLEDEKLGEMRVRDTSQIVIFGRAQVSTMALREAMDWDIPVMYFTYGGYFSGMATGHGHKNVVLREQQFRAAADPGRSLAIAQSIVRSNTRNQRTMLRRNGRDIPDADLAELQRLATLSAAAPCAETLLGLEGSAAAIYFRNLPHMFRRDGRVAEFDFQARNRRPPRDPVNALLSLLYGLLTRECVAAALAVGFDPYMGFFHRPRYGKPALALDLIEEVRPLIADSVALTLINQGEVKPSDFITRADGCNLTEAGRRTVFQAYERRLEQELTHPLFGYRVSWRRALELQARLLSRHLLGEVPEYRPIETR